MFIAEFDGLPDSSATDKNGVAYCGAMKLAEAMVGQDFLGFHPKSRFYQIGTNDGLPPLGIPSYVPAGNDLYPARSQPSPRPQTSLVPLSERERKGVYLTLENANVYQLGEIFDFGLVTPNVFVAEANSLPVLCDVYPTTANIKTGADVGMPILYYKANVRNKSHGRLFSLEENIYNYTDNIGLLNFSLPWMATEMHHPISEVNPNPTGLDSDELRFYDIITNEKIQTRKPYNEDSYILMSAGYDGLYGTADDVFNFAQ
jgi:hypothetical protein